MFRQSYENRIFRHKAFKASVSPKHQELIDLVPVIKKCASKIEYKYHSVFKYMGIEHKDLINIGLVHGVHFLSKYGRSGNEGLLYAFLNQRFLEVAQITHKKSLDCSFTSDSTQSNDVESIIDPLPLPDSPYQDGEYLLHRKKSVHKVKFVTTGMLPILYVDGHKASDAEIDSIGCEINKGVSFLIDVMPIVPPSNDEKEALAYAVLNKKFNPHIRHAASKLCRYTYNIPYNKLKKNLPELHQKMSDKGYFTPDFELYKMRQSRKEYAESKLELKESLLRSSPTDRLCKRCNMSRLAIEFSIKIMSHESGIPMRAIFASYCKICKKDINQRAKNK